MRYKRSLAIVMAAILAVVAFSLASCGGETSESTQSTEAADTSSTEAGVTTTPGSSASGEPIRIGYNFGFTNFMAMDAALTEHGVLTALAQVNNEWNGRPIEVYKVDNASDPVTAVDKTRQLIESNKVSVVIGPIFSPSNAAVTDFLGKSGTGIPCISIFGEPYENLATANKLAFIPAGFHSYQGYILGKYASEELGYKTANVINYEDTTARDMTAGFKRGFSEGGGQLLSEQYVPMDTVDFSSYLTTMKKDADCTCWWIFGNGAGPFVKQYHDYGLTAPLIMEMADNLQEPVMKDLGDIALGIIATDHYVPLIDYPLNKKFVEDYTKQWDGEQPNMDSFGGWLAVNLFLRALDKTNGDTSPEALKAAMATMTLDTPAGQYTMSPYGDAFIGTGSFYITECVKIGDRYSWQPVKVYENQLFEDRR